jgi:hypothetical protein
MPSKQNNRQLVRTRVKRAPYSLTVPSRLDAFAPNEFQNIMTYVDDFVLKTNSGQQYAYWRIKANDIFDPNPLAFSGEPSAFDELALLFRRYLVTRVTIISTITNNETFPVTVISAPSDIDLATLVTTAVSSLNMGELPLAKRVELAPLGGQNRARIRMSLNLARFCGQPGVFYNSNNYSSLVNTSPSVLLYLNWALLSVSNLTAAGVSQFTTYKFHVRWTQRQTPIISSSFRALIRPSEEERAHQQIEEYRTCQKIGAMLKTPQNPNAIEKLLLRFDKKS